MGSESNERPTSGLKFGVVLIVLSIALILITVPTSAQFSKFQGMMAQWHKARICMPCHINTLPESQLNRFLDCSPCHSKGVEISNPEFVKKLHGVNICIKCHVGNEYSRKNVGAKVHVPHKKVECSSCHGEAVALPEARLCTDCHKGGVHGVHGKVLDEICVSCHSENIKDYIPEIKEVEGVKVIKTPQPKVEKVFPSISELIISLIKLIFGA
jgi:hypothetical protein